MGLTYPRGVAVRGEVWPGGGQQAIADGVVLLGVDGLIAAIGPADGVDLPTDLPQILVAWVGPGVVDAHVHLAFGPAEEELLGGVVGVRDLGAPATAIAQWRTGSDGPPPGLPEIRMSGPLLTSPGGYPSQTWGAAGFARFVDSPATAAAAVRELAFQGVDLIKLALETSDGFLPTPSTEQARAIVQTAHEVGLAVTAHALSVAMVARALDAGVDEFCHVPIELLPDALLERIAAAGVAVVSTIQTHDSGLPGDAVRTNAKALHSLGVRLIYGTDLGNGGTRPGVDPRELTQLAEAGLGIEGALRSATEWSSQAIGLRGHLGNGTLRVGARAAFVGLGSNPLRDARAWLSPNAVILDRQVLVHPPEGGGSGASIQV